MKKEIPFFIVILSIISFITTVASDDFFTGTWCIGAERLIITFAAKDSLYVTSKRDETIQGKGTYEKTDSTLTATIKNDDLTLKMGYRYKKKSADMLRAKIAYITVDGDSVNHPRRWMRMEKCDPEKFVFPEETEEDKEPEPEQ
jgi:hypothetical protein